MVTIVLVGHAPMATALHEAASMIIGQQSHVYAKNLYHDTNLDEFAEEIRATIARADQGDGVLVLADVMGGSPGNAAAQSIGGDAEVAVVTGANLPMLLEVLGRQNSPLPELVLAAKAAGCSGVLCVNDLLNDDED
jgi:mannose PTS system EIIA component